MLEKKKHSTFERKVAALLVEHDISPHTGRMLCGLSGGADSVALVLVLQTLGFDVAAMHCNFQLRGEESERDEHFVKQFCKQHKIPLFTMRFNTKAEVERTGESIEMTARRLRYDWFEQVASETVELDFNAESNDSKRPEFSTKRDVRRNYVCVAHHADDNVETMLLNLIRGAGLHGLTGMGFENDRGILRPLLCVNRAEILDYLSKSGENFVTDSTNSDTAFRRNKVRHELLPLLRTMNPSINRTLTATMERLREAESVLDDALLQSEEGRMRRRFVAEGFSLQQIRVLENSRNGAYVVVGNHMLTRHQGCLVSGVVPSHINPTPLHLDFNYVDCHSIYVRCMKRDAVLTLHDRDTAVFDIRKLKGHLCVRSVKEGDRFRPYGMKGSKLVSDFLTDRKRSRLEKLAALVVCDDEGILWLVGETIDQRAAVVSDTSDVVVVNWKCVQ